MVGIFHGLHKIFDGDRMTIMSFKIQICPPPKTFLAEQGMDHAHQFRTLFIHRRRVKIIDFRVGIGPYRMRQRTRIFRKLGGAQAAHIANPLHPA